MLKLRRHDAKLDAPLGSWKRKLTTDYGALWLRPSGSLKITGWCFHSRDPSNSPSLGTRSTSV